MWEDACVLFTGAQGFIGSWVLERLLDEGARVLVLDRPAPELSRFRIRGLDRRCTPVAADLLDADSLRAALDAHRVDTVFHLAAAAIVGTAGASPLSTYEVNVRGTWSVLEACRAAAQPPARVVVASTDKAYGANDGAPSREEDELKPRYPYDASKACADIIARSYASTFGLPVAVTRFANVFGGGDFNFSRLVPGTIKALLAGERPVIRSGGTMGREFMYAPDAVSAYLAVAASLDRPGLHGQAWNAGPGQVVTVLELVSKLIAIAGVDVQADIRGSGTPHGELAQQWLDSSAIREELGWAPEWELQRGLEATYEWYASELNPRPAGRARASAGPHRGGLRRGAPSGAPRA
jgi:CDP-glucose 4,6-dehydratase